MSCRLKSYDIAPPGGFPYAQKQGIARNFPSQPMIEVQAGIVSAFRTKNGLERPSVTECLEDIDAYQCHRLGGMPAYCICTDEKGAPLNALTAGSPLGKPCRGCGAPIFT